MWFSLMLIKIISEMYKNVFENLQLKYEISLPI